MAAKDELDKALADGLNRAKTAKADSPHFFVLVLKGGTEGALLVDRKKIAPALIADAKKRSGGSAVVTGFCYFDRDASEMVFETKKVPAPAWAQVVRKIAQQDAGVSIKARFGLLTNPELIALEGEESQETEGQETPPETGQEAPTGTTPADLFAARAKALEPSLLTFLKGNGPRVNDVKIAYSQSKVVARKGDFDGANALLDKVEQWLKGGGESKPQSGDGKPETGAVRDRVKALLTRLEAVANVNPEKAKTLREVLKAVLAGSPAGADDKLKVVEAQLASMERAGQAAQDIAKSSPVRRASFHKARDQWNNARNMARTQMQKFAQAILSDPEAQEQPDWDDIRAAAQDLVKDLDAFDESLGEAVGRAASDETTERDGGLRDAQTLISKYRQELTGNGIFKLTDGGAYGNFQVAAVLNLALETVAKRLTT
jgi:hypothetical protein